MSIDLSANILSAINVPEGTERLDLSRNKLGSLKGLKLPSTLKTLNLTDNDIQKIDEGTLPGGLETLYLAKNFNLQQKGLMVNIMSLTNLSHLHLTGIFMSYETFACILPLQNLKTLHSPIIVGEVSRGYPSTSKPHVKFFNGDIRFPESLENLVIKCCPKIKSWGQLVLPERLKSVLIDNYCQCDGFIYSGDVKVQTLPLLRFPDGIEEIRVKSYDLRLVIGKIQFPSSLKSLNLSGNDFSPSWQYTSSVLPLLPDVEELNLWNCGLKSIDELTIPSLTKLNITRNSIKDISGFQIPRGLKYTFISTRKISRSNGTTFTRRRHKSGIQIGNNDTIRQYLFGRVWHAPFTWKEDDVHSEYNKSCSLAFFEKEFEEAMIRRDAYLEEVERESWELFM